jgi:magnesium chelatase family protein
MLWQGYKLPRQELAHEKFNREVLDALREPLEENMVTVARAAGAFTYPANFIFVGSMNPCPCG